MLSFPEHSPLGAPHLGGCGDDALRPAGGPAARVPAPGGAAGDVGGAAGGARHLVVRVDALVRDDLVGQHERPLGRKRSYQSIILLILYVQAGWIEQSMAQ